MKVVALGYRFKPKSSIFAEDLNQAFTQGQHLITHALGRVQACQLPAQGWASRPGRVICWLCIWTCWHREAPCWGCSSHPPQGWSCNVATPTCWRRAAARRTRWTGPLNGGRTHEQKEPMISQNHFMFRGCFTSRKCTYCHTDNSTSTFWITWDFITFLYVQLSISSS